MPQRLLSDKQFSSRQLPRPHRPDQSRRICGPARADSGHSQATSPVAEARRKRHQQKLEHIKQHRNSLVQLRQKIQERFNQKEDTEELLERLLLPLIRCVPGMPERKCTMMRDIHFCKPVNFSNRTSSSELLAPFQGNPSYLLELTDGKSIAWSCMKSHILKSSRWSTMSFKSVWTPPIHKIGSLQNEAAIFCIIENVVGSIRFRRQD